jgi:predicted DNA-binding transcriptional regulator YafY
LVYHPTSRVLSVLELLQTYRQMSGPDLAARLEVHVRTIRRYIITLQEMGIPIEAEIGRYGGYTLRPGFKLPPLMFSDDEVLALTLGLLLTRQTALSGMTPTVESALAKIERVLPFGLRERFRALVESMQLDRPLYDSSVDGNVIAALSLASRNCQQVKLLYSTPDDQTERIFDSYGVACLQGYWYTVGYCHLRQATRVFRLDRIERIERLETAFRPPPTFDILDYLLTSFEAIADQWNVEVLLNLPLEEAHRRIPRTYATLVQDGDQVRLRSSVGDLHEMARILIGLGCTVTILQPPELCSAFLDIAAAITTMVSGHEVETPRG